MNISLLRHGFTLILIALLAGIFIPAMIFPRLGLSAHTIGVLSGTLLIAVGAIWQNFRLSARQSSLLKWSWLYSGYANWLGCLVGAVTGAGKMTPIATAGAVGPAFAEGVVMVLLVSTGIAAIVAIGLSLWGLRATATSSA